MVIILQKNTDEGIWINGGTSTLIQNNHITDNGNTACFDNIRISGESGIVIQQNLIDRAASLGIDVEGITGSLTISENTITNSGQNGVVCAGDIANVGIRLDGSNSSITNNIIASNGGAGIVISGGNTSGNLISRNSIYANGTAGQALGIDLDASGSMGDGVTINDSGDSDNGPNGLINFPVITGAFVSGANFVIEGWSRPGTTIELFATDINEGTASAGDNTLGMTYDYGEGQRYLDTLVEGSTSDLESNVTTYTDEDNNTDNTNKFKFSIPLPSGISLGKTITTTATLANSTSEFSPLSTVKAYTVITNRRITYRLKPN
ncbi:right-handed parallel beta-helix repeat-containing protein [Zobellia nedashkovskayae]